MAFWGVEVKPGKPYTHSYQASHGRLRICQAALGNCDAAGRTVLQCNVGNKIPIKLCSLNPKLAEMCHLEIELEEVDDVVFSVIGQSSIHLSGYYVRASSRSNVGDDESESYGEDIGQSDTDEEHDASEDSYESDFIDDRDVPVPEDNYGSDTMDDGDVKGSSPRHHKQEAFEKPTSKVERRRRLKKYQVDSTDDDSSFKPAVKRNAPSIFDSGSDDDDDNVPISVALAKKDSNKVADEVEPPNVEAKDKTRKKSSDARKRKSSAISLDTASPMDITDANASSVSKKGAEIKKKLKKRLRNQLEAEGEKQSKIRTLEDGLIVEDLSTGNLDAKMASSGSKVYIKYVGKLKDGKIVESNVNEKPYKFKLGAGKVIRGWDLGICGMRVGEKRRLTIPASLCYGDKSVGKVPNNSSIIYEIELVKVK
ncbi:peptidyl-prolyl cis-trans isomerase FKBP53 [Phragmites australis]|uniref:peptidyl-prolyl cis-trans isomerase FKBP53 n=1 Tax=Phragmites australis TaxID=29695 RepID=UPI002D794865|nr:peptidyl-prolyl cis-trans isomerase FKBP53 [Phragmites australis]